MMETELICYPYKPTVQVCKICLLTGHRTDVCPTPNVNVCAKCGAREPTLGHHCTPKCAICDGEHPTGDSLCKKKLKSVAPPRKSRIEQPTKRGDQPQWTCDANSDSEFSQLELHKHRWFSSEREEEHQSRSRSPSPSSSRSRSRSTNQWQINNGSTVSAPPPPPGSSSLKKKNKSGGPKNKTGSLQAMESKDPQAAGRTNKNQVQPASTLEQGQLELAFVHFRPEPWGQSLARDRQDGGSGEVPGVATPWKAAALRQFIKNFEIAPDVICLQEVGAKPAKMQGYYTLSDPQNSKVATLTRVKELSLNPSTLRKPKSCPIFDKLTRKPPVFHARRTGKTETILVISLGRRCHSTSNTPTAGSAAPLFDRRWKPVSSASKSDIGRMCARSLSAALQAKWTPPPPKKKKSNTKKSSKELPPPLKGKEHWPALPDTIYIYLTIKISAKPGERCGGAFPSKYGRTSTRQAQELRQGRNPLRRSTYIDLNDRITDLETKTGQTFFALETRITHLETRMTNIESKIDELKNRHLRGPFSARERQQPAAPYDADRQWALLEGPFHRAPVQQLSLTSPTNDPAPRSILASCNAVTKATIALGSIFEDTCTSNAQREPRGASCSQGRYLFIPSERASLKSKHLTCRTAAGLG
ncbi:hypothetical protein HPB49_006462 [Dermacentor silvarum]|uniref:Uncharacterized protein n=1 Tax=Dermacentor silvarum TaxID=543639 RepID=A0ACB8CVU4_DERSI|nr:hypothetical protein HPB49_006462 [Dermacentor silvarum]